MGQEGIRYRSVGIRSDPTSAEDVPRAHPSTGINRMSESGKHRLLY